MAKENPVKSTCERLREEALDLALFEKAKNYAIDYMQKILDQPVFPEKQVLAELAVFQERCRRKALIRMLSWKIASVWRAGKVRSDRRKIFRICQRRYCSGSTGRQVALRHWDQNAALYVISPLASILEEVCENGCISPASAGGYGCGFVGGSSTATLCGLTVARTIFWNDKVTMRARRTFRAHRKSG
jgi:hypothetical protein